MKNFAVILAMLCFIRPVYSQPVTKTFYNPTGTYNLISKKKVKNGETHGYSGEVHVELLDLAHIAVSFYVNKGAPSYNSGSFLDTLDYKSRVAIYKTEKDTSCKITFLFSKKGVSVDEVAENYNYGCSFGHAIVATGSIEKFLQGNRK